MSFVGSWAFFPHNVTLPCEPKEADANNLDRVQTGGAADSLTLSQNNVTYRLGPSEERAPQDRLFPSLSCFNSPTWWAPQAA